MNGRKSKRKIVTKSNPLVIEETEGWIIPESKRQLAGRLNRMADLALDMCGAHGEYCDAMRKDIRKSKALFKLLIRIA